MFVNIDLTPHKIRVVPNSKSIHNKTPINLIGTVLSLQLDEQDYIKYLYNRPEESIIHTIFEKKHHDYVEFVVKTRWDNNTVSYGHYSHILLLSTVIPMSTSIWEPPKKLLKAKKGHNIAEINRKLNKRYRSFNLDDTHTFTVYNDNTDWVTSIPVEKYLMKNTYTNKLSTIQVESKEINKRVLKKTRQHRLSKIRNPFEIQYSDSHTSLNAEALEYKLAYTDIETTSDGMYHYINNNPQTIKVPVEKAVNTGS